MTESRQSCDARAPGEAPVTAELAATETRPGVDSIPPDADPPNTSTIGGTRSTRVLGAVRMNYIYQAIVMIAGLWLTPFLVTHLGEANYGLWIAGTQIVAWLSVMDLGVVALLPREAAYARGVAAVGGDDKGVPHLIDRTLMILLWQLPIVAVITLGVWLLLPGEYDAMRGPLMLIFGAFIVGFPFRIFQAVLTGLQDLVYVSVQTSIGWSLGFVTTVGLVTFGLGLYALAFGFVVVQLYQYVASGMRLWFRHRQLLPKKLSPLAWSDARRLLASGTWVSVAQVAQVLLVGTDVVIMAQLLGAEAVVPYAITGRLVSVLSTQPSVLVQAALPGVSEIRGTSDLARLKRVSSALGLGMLILSTVVFCVVLVVNQSFIVWWGVPKNPYAGDLVTALLLFAMIARHANFSIVLTLFALGGEKRISLTTLADGIMTVVATMLLVPRLGVVAAPLASIAGATLISLPANLRGLSIRAGVPVLEWIRPLWGWMWRFAALALGALILARQTIRPTFIMLGITTAAVTFVVFAVMLPVALRPPLGIYLQPRLDGLRARWLRMRPS
jgi:O-antigen/teichoic acid export membrane protein